MTDSSGNAIRTVNRIGGGVCLVIESARGLRSEVDLSHDQAERLIGELKARPGR